ncbi:MAG: tyrosine-type recombinase/integrase, partial [Longimicrobiales bacterium]
MWERKTMRPELPGRPMPYPSHPDSSRPSSSSSRRAPQPHSPSSPQANRLRDAELLTRTADELRLRGYSPKTRKVYLGHVRRFLESTPHPSNDMGRRRGPSPGARDFHPTPEDGRTYLLELLRTRGLSHSYVNQAVSALKFFFVHVLEMDPPEVRLPRPKVDRSLPVILGRDEVARLLGVLRNRKHRAILMMVYSAGLRVGEVVRLRVQDVDAERMLIHVRKAKGKKDRYVMLS